MIDYDKLYYTNMYNWTMLPRANGVIGAYTIYAKKFSGHATFSYYPEDDKLNLDGLMIHCDSFDKANKLVRDILKVNKLTLHDRYKGRYFKLKKIIKHHD